MEKNAIHIKESHKGRFTEWAKRHGHDGVTSAAIEEGLASHSEKVRKMAQFAKNTKSWKY